MNHIRDLVVAVVFVVASATSWAAPRTPPTVSCADSAATVGNAGYVDCAGAFGGNVMGDASEAGYLTSVWGGDWTWLGKSDDAGSGPFAAGYDGVTSGTLVFDAPIQGLFVLAIKGGPTYSYYAFDGGANGVGSLSFDTLGVAKGNGTAGPGLSHFGLYVQSVPVPEPQTYALMLAGFGLIGFMLRARSRT